MHCITNITLLAVLALVFAPASAQSTTPPSNSATPRKTSPGDAGRKAEQSPDRTGAKSERSTNERGAPTSQPAASSAPAALDPPDSIGRRHNELSRLKNRRLVEKEIALRAGLEFLVALGARDGESAARVVEAVGYQPLPLGEKLPNPPSPTIHLDALQSQISARRVTPIRQLPMACVQLVQRDALHAVAPAIARWMLPEDWAIVISGGVDSGDAQRTPTQNGANSITAEGLFSEPAILVLRLRAGRATVMGGNVLSAIR